MTTPDETPQERPASGPRPGHYGEVSPGVPRYGQYAPEGWQPPSSTEANHDAGPSRGLPPASAYPGYGGPDYRGSGSQANGGKLPPRGAGPVPPGQHLAAPRPVALASRLIMAAGALQALSAVLLLFVLFLPAARSTLIDALTSALPSDPAYSSLLADQSAITGLLVAATVLSLIAAVAYFWLAVKIRRGAGWARTTGLVLAIVSLAALTQPNIFTIVQVGLGVVGIIILFRSPAKEYFAKRVPGNGPHGY
ncbi:hypothetical protein [Arthrobacter sp. SDTb3-6]|uniref:hypothetical protein n=1 Tax=Arthrobacter sp. SDTb3-6 TaxID=2713571 RepID=UPI00159E1F22|nr:hypothetical protein [Arthrobacter sp. SDTb3-6]NVM99779.1 hypothetical protein [Arthrobacter sp. SDTb3-6]